MSIELNHIIIASRSVLLPAYGARGGQPTGGWTRGAVAGTRRRTAGRCRRAAGAGRPAGGPAGARVQFGSAASEARRTAGLAAAQSGTVTAVAEGCDALVVTGVMPTGVRR